MKVLHVINTLSAGGAELHLLTLCRYQKRQGIDTQVVCLREQVKDSLSLRSDFEKESIRVANLEADSRYNVGFLRKFIRVLKEDCPDVLHSHLPRADLAAAFGKFLHPSMIWVSSVHDIYNRSWSGKWTLPLFSFLWRQADSVVAISHAVKHWLVSQRGIPADKVTVVHYGIEPERFSKANVDQEENGCLQARGIVGSIGRLEPRKAHDCLIRAIPATLEQAPKASLLIAGHDPWGYGKHLQALIEELRLKEKVRLVGFQADVALFISALDVFAFASRSEGFGQVVIEAMAAGKPVVASKIPPLTEIVVEGETGRLVEPGQPQAFADAISRLLMHPEEARQMGRRGQERVQRHFSAEKMSSKILLLYDELFRARSVTRSLA